MNHFFGAHQSIAGGYHKALERVSAIGGNALQIFSASPRGWNFATIHEEQKQVFITEKERAGVGPVFFHASYLVNFADNDRIGKASTQSLIAELSVASQLGITGSIVHLGSFKTNNGLYETLIGNIEHVLAHTPSDTYFIIENAGNKKIGKDLGEIATIVRDVGSDRIRICLDTCHLYSAGYDLSTQEKLDMFLDEFNERIGLEKLVVIHANDSRDPYNSGRDRHENLGEGTMSLAPFALLVNDKRTAHVPFILETPGFDGNGPDLKNMDILKSLAKQL